MILRAPQAIERKGYSTRRYRRLRLISGLKGARYIGSAVAVQIRQGEGAAGTRCARQRPKRQGPGKTRAAALDLRTADGEIFEDQPGGAADLFKSREVAIVKNAPPGAATKHVPIARLEAGDVFGETALIDGRNRSASAIAIGKVVELVIESSYSERELDGRGVWSPTRCTSCSHISVRCRRVKCGLTVRCRSCPAESAAKRFYRCWQDHPSISPKLEMNLCPRSTAS
jgi:hypothetical protein